MPSIRTHVWAEYAVDLYVRGMAPSRPGHRPVSAGMRINGTHGLVEILALEFGDGDVAWTVAMARRALALARPGPRGPDGVSFTAEGFDALHQVAAARMGLAMALGDVSTLSRAERALVADCARHRIKTGVSQSGEDGSLRRVPLDAPVPCGRHAAVGVPPTLGFGFAWARRSGAGTSATAGRSHARMVEARASDLAPACRLATPDGGALEVLHDVHGFLRPVTAPGSWDPVDVATFLDAAWSGARWADNPFVPARRDLPVLSLAELASSGRDGVPSREAAAAIVASVGTLVAVGGVVHRRCPPPEACVTRDGRGGPAAVTWRIPGQVEATDDMGCLRLDQHRALRLDVMDDRGEPFRAGTEHRGFATLPLAEAAALAGMTSEVTFQDVEVAAPGSRGGFEVLAPGAWPNDPVRVLASLAEWAAAVPRHAADDAVVEARHALAAALAVARRGGAVELPDTSAAEAALELDAPAAALWGRRLRERAFGPGPEDDAMAAFAP